MKFFTMQYLLYLSGKLKILTPSNCYETGTTKEYKHYNKIYKLHKEIIVKSTIENTRAHREMETNFIIKQLIVSLDKKNYDRQLKMKKR